MVVESQVAVTPVEVEALFTDAATLAPVVPAVKVNVVPLMLNDPGLFTIPPVSVEDVTVAWVPDVMELIVIKPWAVMGVPLKSPAMEMPVTSVASLT